MSENVETMENFEEMLNAFEQEQKKTRVKNGKIMDMQDTTVFIDVGEKVEGGLPKKEITDENGELLFNIGDDIPVLVKKNKTRNGEPILSHKMALEESKRREFLDKFNVGDKLEVTITVLNKGGFVAKNSDGIEFFIPKSESALKLQDDNVGKKIEAQIIEIKKNGVVLSRKQLLKEKKEERNRFIETIKDDVIKATVKNLKKDGVVIELEGGWSGFVPKDEVSFKKLTILNY